MDAVSPHHGRRGRAIRLAVGTSLLSKGGTILLQIVALPVAVAFLGVERFGVYATLMSVMWVIGLVEIGIGPGLSRRVAAAVAADDPAEAARLVSTAFVLVLALAVTGLAVFLVVVERIPVERLFGPLYAGYEETIRFNLRLAGALFFTMLVLTPFGRCREGHQEVHVTNTIGAAGNVVSAVVLLVGIRFLPSIAFLMVSIYGVGVVAQLVNAVHLMKVRRHLVPSLRRVDRGLVAALLREGSGFFLAMSAAPILRREGTKLMLAHLAGPSVVAVFAVLVQIGFFVHGFVTMFTTPLWPAFVDAFTARDLAWVERTRRRAVAMAAAFGGAAVVGLTAAGPALVDWWLDGAVPIARILMFLGALVFALTAWEHVQHVLLTGMGVIQRPAWVMLAEAVAVVAGAALVFPAWGLEGVLAVSAAVIAASGAWILPVMVRRRLAWFRSGVDGSAVVGRAAGVVPG